MHRQVGPHALLYPTAVWLVILFTLFATEYLVMLSLTHLLPGEPSPLVGALVDSLIITTVLAPIIWRGLVRPLREVIRLRTKFLGDLFAAIEQERRQTAHELHDGIGQELSLLISGLRSAHQTIQDPEDAARCLRLTALAQSALREVKRIALGLRPSVLNDFGLVAAMEKVAGDFNEHSPVEITLKTDAMAGIRLPDQTETTVFRIFQEGLANIIRHSGAGHAVFELFHQEGTITLDIRDDGHGFDPKVRRESTMDGNHMGLTGIRERAALLGGRFMIESAPGHGCHLRITIPCGETIDA